VTNFRRNVVVEVARAPGASFRSVSGLSVRFDARRSGTRRFDSASVSVVGFDSETLAGLRERGAVVRVLASYGDAQPVEVVQGQVVRGSLEETPTGNGLREVTLQIGDGLDVRRQAVSIERGGPVDTRALLDEVAAAASLPTGPIEPPTSVTYERGYASIATVAEHLNAICRDADASWSVQSGRLVVWTADGEAEVRDLVLSPDTGLIGYPIAQDEAVVFVSQLVPGMAPGDVVTANTRDYSGSYVVREVQHVGGSRTGDFQTRLTCVLRTDVKQPTAQTGKTPTTNRPTLSDALDTTREAAVAAVESSLTVRVEAFDAAQQTVDVTQLVAPRFESGGEVTFAEPVTLKGVPVRWERSGSRGLTYGIEPGDLGYIIVRGRSHDEVDAGRTDGTTQPASKRRHALRDAYFVPGYQPVGGLSGSDYRSDGQPVFRLPSGEALHVGSGTAGRAVADGPKMLDRIERLEAAVNLVAQAAGITPPPFSGAATFTPGAPATLLVSQVSTNRIKVDS